MKTQRTIVSIVAIGCLIVALSGNALLAYGATDSDKNTKGVRSSEISLATATDDGLLLDDNNTTPEQAVLALVEAENAADWQKVYSDLSAYTAWCYEYVRADLAYQTPKYSDFHVLTTDFIQLDNSKYARVEVAYTLTYKDCATGEQKTITRNGDWWTVFTENGIWKVEYANGTPGSTFNPNTPPDVDIVLNYEAQPSVFSIVRFAG